MKRSIGSFAIIIGFILVVSLWFGAGYVQAGSMVAESPGGSAGETIEDLDVDVTVYPESTRIVLKGAALLDAAYNGEVLDVVVLDGMIVDVGNDLDGDVVIDLAGCTLLPGLIDAHVHVAGSSGYNLELLKYWCTQGITSVREEGMLSTENEEDYLPLIQLANEDPACAFLVSCGKYLDEAGGYGMGPTGNMGITITGAAEASAEITHKAELGYPQVKVGINSDTNRMNEEEFTAIMENAHGLGMPVAAHVKETKYLEELLAYGLDEAAHTPDDEMSASLIAAMVEQGVYMNTSGGSDSDIKIRNLKNFYEAGGFITVGTDKMRGYGTCMASLIAEMQCLTQAGLSVRETIACATRNNAAALKLDTGIIEIGMQADLIAVPGVPDASFEALLDPVFIMNDGAVIEKH